MYTGLVIDELFKLVERAEEHASDARRVPCSLVPRPELLPRFGWEVLQENMLQTSDFTQDTMLAGVA
ncbi:MAG: hypothetical protein AB7O65_00895 [Candidatus Korobacteraceae bacterium]